MFARIPEKFIHLTRWSLTLGWLLLIASLFVDPFSAQLTTSGQFFAASQDCFQFQGECRPLAAYPMGARIFWGMVLPLVVLILLILGHEAWRRICPLSFLSQLARGLGWQRKRTISETSWLGRNALYWQMGLLFIGLNLRLLLVNSDRLLLGIFLIFTIVSAITIGFLYDGKTWCNYVCPMAPVQIIYSEPSGLLGSAAHTAPPKTITQSMCRTVDRNGQEKSACVACKIGCMDIDAEAAYWDTIRQADRKLLYYGYVGLVIGFYLYFGLYSANWSLLSAGVWNETNQLVTLMQPGFFVAGRAIPIPKLLAVPLTLTFSTGLSYTIGLWIELKVKRTNKRLGYPLSLDQVQSRLFASSTFIAFNLLFFLGVRPTLGYLPVLLQHFLSWGAVVASSLWLAKTWYRSAQKYHRERDANLLKRQLYKLDIDLYEALEGRSLDELNPDELYALARVLPGFTQANRLQVYRGILREAFEQKSVVPTKSLRVFQPIRQNLGIDEETHWAVIQSLQLEEPELFAQQRWPLQGDTTVYHAANQSGRLSRNPGAESIEMPKERNLDATVYRSTSSTAADQSTQSRDAADNQANSSSGENTTVIKPFEATNPETESKVNPTEERD